MKKENRLSLDDEMIFWTSYRYCIGRHTYVTSLADYMAKKYWNLLSDGQKRHAAQDIRECISDNLRMGPLNMQYEYTIPQTQRKGLEDLLDVFAKENITNPEKIKSIRFYKKDYKETTPVEYEIEEHISPRQILGIPLDLGDLIPWMRLAELFDIDNHKVINGHTVFESYREKLEPVDDKYYRAIPYQYEKCYIDVEEYVDGSIKYVKE